MGKKSAATGGSAENVKVIVRCRPLNEKEKAGGARSCVELSLQNSSVSVASPDGPRGGEPEHKWSFDAVVNNTLSQADIFTQFIAPMADSVLEGYNATVFAYGQSGSGKTHTMTGKLEDPELHGVTPRAFQYFFDNVRQLTGAHPNRTFTVGCTYVELYNGKVRDLLAKQQVTLAVKENKDKSFFVQGVHHPTVDSAAALMRFMDEGSDRRRTGSTELNDTSSRSHSVFSLSLQRVDVEEDGETRVVHSKFNLVDLAGSERQTKTQASGDTLKEGCNINLSLSALGTVIDTIVKGKGHVPFRSSPLTMLLKDSLGGNSKTCMFANVNPSDNNEQETISTLRFADRAKQIKNKPTVNMDAKDMKIVELQEQVATLQRRLEAAGAGGPDEFERQLAELRDTVDAQAVELTNARGGREAEVAELQAAAAQARKAAEKSAKAAEAEQQRALEAAADLQLALSTARDEAALREELACAAAAALGVTVDADGRPGYTRDPSLTPGAAPPAEELMSALRRLADGALIIAAASPAGRSPPEGRDASALRAALEDAQRAAREATAAHAAELEAAKAALAKANAGATAAAAAEAKASSRRHRSSKDAGAEVDGGASPRSALKSSGADAAEGSHLRAPRKPAEPEGDASPRSGRRASSRSPAARSVTSAAASGTGAASPQPSPAELARVAAAEAEAAEARRAAAAAAAEVEAMKGRLHALEKDAKSRDKKARAAGQRSEESVRALEEELKRRADLISQLRDSAEGHQRIVKGARRQAAEAEAALDDARSEVAAVERQRLGEAEQRDRDFEGAVRHRVEEALAEHHRQLAVAQHEARHLKKKLKKAKSRYDEAAAAHDERIVEMAQMEERLGELKVETLRAERAHREMSRAVGVLSDASPPARKTSGANDGEDVLRAQRERRRQQSQNFGLGDGARGTAAEVTRALHVVAEAASPAHGMRPGSRYDRSPHPPRRHSVASSGGGAADTEHGH